MTVVTDAAQSPWVNPPERKKPLRRRRAEKQARQAEHWGRRLQEAAEEGPNRVAAVTFDRLRSVLNQLPEAARDRGYEAVSQALESVREKYAQ